MATLAQNPAQFVPAAKPPSARPVRARDAKQDKPQRLSQQHPLPPEIILGPSGKLVRGNMLGEGGFARVFVVKSSQGRKAVKVVAKTQLKSSKARGKLFAEIKLHQALSHPNIISFHECFEDAGNVYMLLELCAHGSMLDILRERKRYTEPESRFYLVQLVCACEYMHSHSVIHRDLKLGNLMLDANMNLKIGDFGLAALVAFPGERKKTICGTPNYIAPEILFDRTLGHSFEADIWSIGVILYTLLIGKPPFQTKDVDTIYNKIRHCEYEFPDTVPISKEAKDLVTDILTTDPKKRPSLQEILVHPFMKSGNFPASIPDTATKTAPDFSSLTRRESYQNMKNVMQDASDWVAPEDEISPPDSTAPKGLTEHVTSPGRKTQTKILSVNACDINKHQRGVDKEVKHALEPGSPIADLLKSARKPLLVSPRNSEPDQRNPMPEVPTAMRQREKEDKENMMPLTTAATESTTSTLPLRTRLNVRPKEDAVKVKPTSKLARPLSEMQQNLPKASSASDSPTKQVKTTKAEQKEVSSDTDKKEAEGKPDADSAKILQRELYEICWKKLEAALYHQTVEDTSEPAAPKVFITSWIDYTHKYGTAYQLTDGTSGVYFNDNTSLILSPEQKNFDYIANKRGQVYGRRNYPIDEAPTDLERKVYLLKYFENYMRKTLERDVDWTFIDMSRTRNMDFLVKYYRMKDAIVFKLSNGVIQFNFFDQHTKILLSSAGSVISFIGSDYKIQTWSLNEIISQCNSLKIDTLQPKSTLPRAAAATGNSKERDQIVLIVSRLKYCVEVLKALGNRKSGSS